jgi:hypothetical protein
VIVELGFAFAALVGSGFNNDGLRLLQRQLLQGQHGVELLHESNGNKSLRKIWLGR